MNWGLKLLYPLEFSSVAVAEMLGHPIEGEVQDLDCMTEQGIIKIEQKHDMVPRR